MQSKNSNKKEYTRTPPKFTQGIDRHIVKTLVKHGIDWRISCPERDRRPHRRGTEAGEGELRAKLIIEAIIRVDDRMQTCMQGD